jgi:hypothetical protein
MFMEKRAPAAPTTSEIEKRVLALSTQHKVIELFEKIASLPVCVAMDSNSTDREVWNVQNGIVLTEHRSAGAIRFKIYSGDRYSWLDIERMEKLLAAWSAMMPPVERLTSDH